MVVSMKIIQFEDGSFGVRRGFFGYEFASHSYKWYSKPEDIYICCRFSTLEDARNTRAILQCKHKVVE